MYNDWMFGHGFFMPWMIVFPIALILIFMMMRHNEPCQRRHDEKEDEALEIARKRYARGEIDEETFDKIKQKLS